MSHSHSHSNTSASHSHDDHEYNPNAPLAPSPQNYIYHPLDFPNIVVQNEATAGSGRAILEKGWANHLNPLPELVSSPTDASDSDSDSDSEDAPGEILLYIPFTAQCRLTHLLVASSPDPSAPHTIHLFSNPPGSELDFSTAQDLTPTQTVEAVQTNGLQELPLQRARWAGVRAVGVHIKDNYGRGDETRLSFLGLKGEWTQLRREAVSVLYEAAANPRDHAPIVGTGGLTGGSRIGGA